MNLLGSAVLSVSRLDIDLHMRLGSGTADQYTARVRQVDGVTHVLHLSLDQRRHAGMANTRARTEIRAESLRQGRIIWRTYTFKK